MGGIFEGATESLTREVCQKYNIQALSFGHQEETHIFQQIEKIIGRDSIIENCYLKSYDTVENVEKLSELIANSMEIHSKDYVDFKKYAYYDNEYFSGIKQGKNKEEQEKIYQNYKEASNNLRENLDKYVQNNSDKLYDLGKNSKELSTEQMSQKQLAYNKVLELQDIEIEYLKLIVDNPVLGKLNKYKEQNDNMII